MTSAPLERKNTNQPTHQKTSLSGGQKNLTGYFGPPVTDSRSRDQKRPSNNDSHKLTKTLKISNSLSNSLIRSPYSPNDLTSSYERCPHPETRIQNTTYPLFFSKCRWWTDSHIMNHPSIALLFSRSFRRFHKFPASLVLSLNFGYNDPFRICTPIQTESAKAAAQRIEG